MNATGIIVEYNPLHNGHLYHINETKKQSQCDVLIAVMSGNFVQRGEPALFNKQIRTKQALQAGVDLVIELPYLYSVQSANFFALGAITLLDALKVSNLYFGSESGDIGELTRVANLIDHPDVTHLITLGIKDGLSYPVATSNALSQFTNFHLEQPNDILGIRYIKSINSLKSPITPFTIKRTQSHYHDEQLSHSRISSATSIRRTMFNEEDSSAVKGAVPQYVYEDLTSHKLTSWNDFYPYLKYKVITSGKALLDIHEMNHEIYNRLMNTILTTTNFEQLVNVMTTKRLTRARLQRVLSHILVDVKKEQINNETLEIGPNYLRILGISKTGQEYLKKKKKAITLPLITNITKDNYSYIAFEEKVSDLYHLIDQGKKRKIPLFK